MQRFAGETEDVVLNVKLRSAVRVTTKPLPCKGEKGGRRGRGRANSYCGDVVVDVVDERASHTERFALDEKAVNGFSKQNKAKIMLFQLCQT